MFVRGFIALGSNLGDREAMIDRAVEAMEQSKGLEVIATSSIYETEPVGPPQPAYLNAVCEVRSAVDALTLLACLHAIERRLGRVRDPSTKNGPRTIDLDLLMLGDAPHESPELTLPHPRLQQRAFVLVPLLELWPTATLPESRTPLASHLSILQGTNRTLGVAMWRARVATSG